MPTKIVYSDDSKPGITRKKMRNGWGYWDAKGERITDRDEIDRLNAIALPPAYRDAWFCPKPNGHIQAVGWDERGRKQYRYHLGFREAQEAAKYAVPLCLDQCVTEIYYDCIGVGAGFKAQANTMRESGALPSRIKVMPWDASTSPLEPERPIIPNDRDSPKNADHFLNMKAQAWWRLRTRFYKTYRAVLHGEEYPADELISLESGLPHLHQLEMELTQAEYAYNQAGKMLVDKRPNGALSPNLADAVVMCYCRPHATSSLFDV